jgi:hypothetical protein
MIQTGDIILVRGNMPIVSSLVRWFTNSEYTHVAMAVSDELVIEIDINKDLAIRPLTYDNYDVFRYKKGLSVSQQASLQYYATQVAKTSKGYDWLRILQFACEKLFRTKKTFNEVHRFVCSEIVDNLYDHINIDLVPEREDGNVTPGQLANSPKLIKVSSSIGA